MKKLVHIIPLLFFLGYSANGYAQDKIHWFTDSAKTSAQLTQDISVPLSALADTNRLLMTALSQYQFNIEYAQSPSIARLLKKLPNSCAPNRMKTPDRLKDNIYSLPLNIALGLRLYFKQTAKLSNLSQKIFNKNTQSISLPSLFVGKSTYNLGIEKGRSYGVSIDAEINSLEKHNLVIRRGDEATKSLVRMLLKDRIDYMIDYPFDMSETLSNLSSEIEIGSLPITSSSDYIVGYVACHKGSLGQRIIEDINTELQKLYRSYPFYHAHIRYLDKTDLVDFNRAYQEVFNVAIPLKISR
ncbi:hypothetical protein CXF85_07280 [Colwellia sp. 75C3]|uniref:hypothetical protein n=1 Tax=Colwellia sp. 75C3 TaxID=888425 RepID=UPI000C343211|nr:hypothetical protein [Colwellia sp. 75C3]PKG85381.1 hypothetical protein CXF85_07280 [Colwellia sp. 75C3]